MKKIVIGLLLVALVLGTTMASARCINRDRLVGAWERFDASTTALGSKPIAAMNALEAGDKKLEELIDEWGTGSSPGRTQALEFSDSGELTSLVTVAASFDDDVEVYILFTMKGAWTLDCDTLRSEAASVENIETSIAHLTEEQQKQVEEAMPELLAEMEEEHADRQILEQFGLIPGHILYSGESYVLLDIDEGQYIEYIILKKQ